MLFLYSHVTNFCLKKFFSQISPHQGGLINCPFSALYCIFISFLFYSICFLSSNYVIIYLSLSFIVCLCLLEYKLTFSYINLFVCYICVQEICTSLCTCKRTIFRSQFLPSPMWVPRTKPSSSDLATSTLNC